MADAACARIEPKQVYATINWPVHIGSMANVFVPHYGHAAAETLVCHRGSVTDLCEVAMQSPNSNFQVKLSSWVLFAATAMVAPVESALVGRLYCMLQRSHL